MKHKVLSLFLALAASAGIAFAETGIGVFSVSSTQKVTFSPGNLQFNAAQGTHICADGTTRQGTWRFAGNQWDVVGMGYGQTTSGDWSGDVECIIGGTVQDGDNRLIGSAYDGWIDLFGLGTSGWDSGEETYQPWATTDCYPGTDLTGEYANADWGVFNRIGDDAPGTWRTLTVDEWMYLLYSRSGASGKYGAATVNGVTGMVLLPDEWTLPAGCGFTPGLVNADDWDNLCFWSFVAPTNIYSDTQWRQMEANGAVFLPTAGRRIGTVLSGVGCEGLYWASRNSNNRYTYLWFYADEIWDPGDMSVVNSPSDGYAVRLVSTPAAAPETFTVTFVNYDGSELQSGPFEPGATPEYTGETPERPADGQYTYTFAGWTPEITAVTGDATYTAVFSAVLPSDIVLQENEDADYYTQFAQDYNGHAVLTATLNRQFKQGQWATLCLPFDVSKGQVMSIGLGNRVYEFRYADVAEDKTVQIFFSAASSIEAGKCYIVNANAKLAQKTSFVFQNVTIDTSADNEDITALTGYNDGSGRGSMFLVGTLRTGLLKGMPAGNTWLGLKNNRIYYPNTTKGTSLRAYRGLFRCETPIDAQRVRVIVDGEDAGEWIIENEELRMDNSSAVKYMENGILHIRSNGRTYNAQGQLTIDN